MPVQTRSKKGIKTANSTVRPGCPTKAVRTRRKRAVSVISPPTLTLAVPVLPLEEPTLPLETEGLVNFERDASSAIVFADIRDAGLVADLENSSSLWDNDPDELRNFSFFEREITDLGDFMRKWARANISQQAEKTLFTKYLRLFFRRYVEAEEFAQPKSVNTSLGNKLKRLFRIEKADHNGVTNRQPCYRGIGLRDVAARARFEKITRLPRNIIEYDTRGRK